MKLKADRFFMPWYYFFRQGTEDSCPLVPLLRIWIRKIFKDPDPLPGVLESGSRSVSYSNEHNKINWKGKFNKVLVCLLVGSCWDLLTRKMKSRCIKSTGTVLGTVHYLFEMARIWIKQSELDLYQIEKQDPDPYQSEQQDLDPYQKVLVPRHCLVQLLTTYSKN